MDPHCQRASPSVPCLNSEVPFLSDVAVHQARAEGTDVLWLWWSQDFELEWAALHVAAVPANMHHVLACVRYQDGAEVVFIQLPGCIAIDVLVLTGLSNDGQIAAHWNPLSMNSEFERYVEEDLCGWILDAEERGVRRVVALNKEGGRR